MRGGSLSEGRVCEMDEVLNLLGGRLRPGPGVLRMAEQSGAARIEE